ncbi:hypothetical protein JCM10914_2704 [Paenibacillus sp. JCM 10914]|nr:hypothetical protein JCM10914_2704 [Paenibacillus sp. JCM 10914]
MQIAESLEISVRTVYRYIDALCAIRIHEPLALKDRIGDMAYGIAKHYESNPV